MIVPYVHYFSLLQSQRLFHDILSCKNCSSCATSKSHFSSNSIQPCGRLVCKQPHMAACLANVVVTCRGKRLEIAEMVCFKCFELTVAKSSTVFSQWVLWCPMYILSRKNSENQQVYVHNDVHFASDLLRTSSSFHIFSHLFTFHLRWGTLEIAFTTLALQCSSAGSNGPSFDSNFSWRGQRHVRHVWGSSTDLLDWEGRVQQMTSFAFSMILILILHVRTVLYRNVQCGFLQVKTLDHDPLSLKLFFNLRHIYCWSLSKCLEFCPFESLGFLLDFFATAGIALFA